MKTLPNQTLLYDSDCPLCQVYTSGFIKTKMLDANGRIPFHKISEKDHSYVNFDRATDEIALIDTKNKTVIYGVDSLLKILGNSFPSIETIGKMPPIHFLLKKLYAFISYNRKVIIPNNNSDNQKLECVPKFNIVYRQLYILFAIVITTLVLYNFSNSISILPKASLGRELILASAQIIFQGIFLFREKRKTIITYVGNLMTVSLFGSLLLLPIIILNSFVVLPETLLKIWFGMTVLVMFFEHYRRVKILKLPSYLSYTWVLYRIIALVFILNLI